MTEIHDMSVATTAGSQSDRGHDRDCGSGDACGCMPAEFTRLRYAYGLRLGAVELSDEQSYLVGKHRFHNARCHGAGVLCGLRVDRFTFPQGSTSPSTVIRVTRGAALDACGREILVPVDQCIDVNAWFLKNSAQLSLPSGTASLPMRVALRYRECPSDPAPVPRDPCGCDASGCDYTRVREGFELRLFAGNTLPACDVDVFPDAAELLKALGVSVPVSTPAPSPGPGTSTAADPKPVPSSPKVSHLVRKLDELTAASCPAMKNEWICLADFIATLDSTGATVTTIPAPDNAIPGRHVLLSTAALQALVIGLAGAFRAEGFLGVGPTLGGISFANATSNSGTLNIAVNLITDPGSATPAPLATFNPAFLQVFPFDPNSGWGSPLTTSTASVTSSPPQISVPLTGVGPGYFRVSLVSPEGNPIVDTHMRLLRPMNYSASFQLVADKSGNLTLVPLHV
jgi:hypothetical protein